MHEAVTPNDYLRKRAFQDWLVVNDILVRFRAGKSQDASSATLHKTGHLYEGIGSLAFSYLQARQGYITPYADIQQAIAPVPQTRELYDAVATRNVNNWMHHLQTYRLDDPGILYHAQGLGWALGVQDFRASPEKIIGLGDNFFKDITLDPHFSLKDLTFQDWLSDQKLIVRTQSVPDLSPEIDLQRKDHTLLYILQTWRNYIVPYGFLSMRIYGEEGQMKKIGRTFRELRAGGYLKRDTATVVPNFGIGLGIKEAFIDAKNLELLRILWHSKKKTFSSYELLDLIWGQSGPSTLEDREKLYTLLSTTRSILEKTDHAIVVTGGRDKKLFRLVPKVDLE